MNEKRENKAMISPVVIYDIFENELSVLGDSYPYHIYYAHAPITQLMFSKCIFFK